jgi:hypothetical protein
MSVDSVIGLWREGERRLRELDPADRGPAERVVVALVDELRRRLGGAFTADELAGLYLRDGTDWCFDIAVRVAPSTPEAWDITTVGGAAFLRYVRSASDFAGGRRRVADD